MRFEMETEVLRAQADFAQRQWALLGQLERAERQNGLYEGRSQMLMDVANDSEGGLVGEGTTSERNRFVEHAMLDAARARSWEQNLNNLYTTGQRLFGEQW